MKTTILELRAKEIANLVAITSTDERGQLYQLVAVQLRREGQYFTARLFATIGEFDEGLESNE